MPEHHDEGDFREYRRLIMDQLRVLATRADAHEREITTLRVNQATLMVRVGLISAGVGAAAAAIVSKVVGAF